MVHRGLKGREGGISGVGGGGGDSVVWGAVEAKVGGGSTVGLSSTSKNH